MELTDWMRALDGTQPLLSLNLPATHDSAAVKVHFPRRSQCQRYSIYEQLCLGVRSLDIRVAPKRDGGLVVVHGIDRVLDGNGRAMDFAAVTAQCRRFLEEHPQEAVVLQFKNDNNRHQQLCARRLREQYIAPMQAAWWLGTAPPSLEEARGKLVLVRRCASDKPFGIDFSRWREQDFREPQPLVLKTGNTRFLIQDRYAYPPAEKWEQVLLPQLDRAKAYDGQVHYHYTSTAGGRGGPRKNAAYINRLLAAYPFEKGKYYGTVYYDFITEALARQLVETNF
ncbi:MAG: phosphatidylinositol-specific phospholipase C domain-containing protein [Eubacterium sp.]|nr:phosphatidylinositol-specific phospholipase C domain-containing protein [Eubacterium sp.]